MAESPTEFQGISSELDRLGLSVFGNVRLTAELVPDGSRHFLEHHAILIGNAGGKMWEAFARSDEYADKLPNPLDRWTKHSIDRLTKKFGAKAIYPFDKPFWPFQRIASEASGMQASPLGMYIHPVFGLWQAYRALLVFGKLGSIPWQPTELTSSRSEPAHPCDQCDAKPCLTACPVGAFDPGSLSVEKCFSHLYGELDPDCMSIGCRARDACPVGTEYRYSNAQIRFHMAAFKN